MTSDIDFISAHARIMDCSDFIYNIAARDRYCGLCYTKICQGLGHENATQELEAITLFPDSTAFGPKKRSQGSEIGHAEESETTKR